MDAEVLQSELNRINKSLVKEKDRSERLVNAVYSAVFAGMKDLKIPKVPKPPADRRRNTHEEVAVAVLSDWQLGKETLSYNTSVCEERIERYADKVIEFTRLQRAHHRVRKLQVWGLGDIVEGEMIFPGQEFLIHSSLYRQVSVDGVRIVTNFLLRMLQEFDEVEVHWVIGNHGRITGVTKKSYNPETNMDRMLGRILKYGFDMAGEKRIKWVIPEGKTDSWFDLVDIGGWKALLIHGDQINISSEKSIRDKIQGWKSGAMPGRNNAVAFDDVYAGHFHHIKETSFNNTIVTICGSPESDNEFAREVMASIAKPSQEFFFVKPGFGPTCRYHVWLDK